MKEQVEFVDRDFLDNKIEIGYKVIFETPKYRDFAIGTVITKAPKSCQIEYLSFAGHSKGYVDVVRQCYGQVIKYPLAKEGTWIIHTNFEGNLNHYECSECHKAQGYKSNYCEDCGTKMMEE